MKRPLLFIITDIHLSENTYQQVEEVVYESFTQAISRGFNAIDIIGDIFDSRKSQSLTVLESWERILDRAYEIGLTLRVIPGNHDKPNYNSERSYLDIFKKHPAQDLYRVPTVLATGENVELYYLPFFDEKKTLPKYLEDIVLAATPSKKSRFKRVLLTHIAIDGVMNNDGSKIEGSVSKSDLKVFDKIFVGHYHNEQKFDNVHYIGSLMPKNFGEDNNKGATVVYNDLSTERVELGFKKYVTEKIDLNSMTQKEIEKVVEKHSDSKDNVRFKFQGTREKLDSIKKVKSKFEEKGIDTKFEEFDPEINLDYTTITEFSGFEKETIIEEWNEFSTLNEIDDTTKESGLELLTETLKE